MRTSLNALIAASTLVVGIAAAPALYAHDSDEAPGTQVPPVTHGNMMGQGNPMGQGTTMDIKKMTDQMNQMMKSHSKAMQTMMDEHGAVPSDKAPSNKE